MTATGEDRRTDRRTDRRRERAEAMVDAALRVIRRQGVACSVDDVARELGVTRPVVYRYFGSRDGLAAAVADRVANDIGARIVTAMEQVTAREQEAGGRELVRRGVDAYLSFIEDDPELYRYLVRGPLGRDGDGSARLAGFVDGIGTLLAATVGDRLRAAGRDPGAAEPWAFALVGMIGFAGEWWLERSAMPRARLVDHLTDLAWRGMGGPAPPGPGDPERDRG